MADERGSEGGMLPRSPVVWQGPGKGKEIEFFKFKCQYIKKSLKVKNGHYM